MKVIINADDFGYSHGQNLGILECFQNGIVSSTSLMVNMPGFEHAVSLMKQYPLLKVGLHFVMTVGKPVSQVTGLTNELGYFDKNKERLENASLEQIEEEYRAQLNKFLSTGFIPNHLDYHVSCNHKQYEIIMKLAKEYQIPIRASSLSIENIAASNNIKHSKNFIEDFYDKGVSLDTLIKIFEDYKDQDIIEIMCHPAYVDATILKNSSYNIQRAYEKEILTSSEIKDYLSTRPDIEIISYDDL